MEAPAAATMETSTTAALMRNFLDEVIEGNLASLSVVFSVVIVLLTILFIAFLRGSSRKRNTVLLMGPCDAGKSLLFLRLVHKQFAMTCSSMKDNKGHFIAKIKDKILTLVDIPGHERLRGQYLDEYGSAALGIVFVVDSSTISRKTVADVAEFLYSILTDPVIFKNKPRVLIACNKQDHDMAKRQTAVKSMLETEINTVRKTRSGALESTSEDSFGDSVFLGREDRDFEFSHMGNFKVDFAEANQRTELSNDDEHCNLKEITDWLEDIA